jgi:hypothetical protein
VGAVGAAGDGAGPAAGTDEGLVVAAWGPAGGTVGVADGAVEGGVGGPAWHPRMPSKAEPAQTEQADFIEVLSNLMPQSPVAQKRPNA